MIAPRQRQPERRSMWNRDPNLVIAILLCALISVFLDIIGVRLINLPKSIVYPVIIIADAAILIAAALRMSAASKRAAEARREAYRQKFEVDLEAIKAWSERRGSGKAKKES